jgi:hypothetical protein
MPVVLSLDVALKEQLDKRSGIYSDRQTGYVHWYDILQRQSSILDDAVRPALASDPQDDPQPIEDLSCTVLCPILDAREQADACTDAR